jgi:hypothetical protein
MVFEKNTTKQKPKAFFVFTKKSDGAIISTKKNKTAQSTENNKKR